MQVSGQEEELELARARGLPRLLYVKTPAPDREPRLAERFDFAWLAAWSLVQLGTLAIVGNRLEEARALLDEGLELSLAVRSTRSVGLYLPAFARLAFVEGDTERAALLVGATEGLRRRLGLQAWPMLRQGEAELVVQIRQALGRTGSTRWLPPVPGSTAGRR
jgi:hypothetical protein